MRSAGPPGRLIAAGLTLGLALALAGGLTAFSSSAGAQLSIVASTNVWGGVAEQVVGRFTDRVRVQAIITDPAADPHSYEVSTRDELAIKRADVILENGGGYDDFVGTMRAAAAATGTVLDAVRISGKAPAGGQLNEHVWYDFPTVARVAGRIAAALAAADSAHASGYRANARAFAGRLQALERTEAAVAGAHRGQGVAITEPVPLYLLQACGLVNRTPPAFSEAIENEQDVAVQVMQQTRDLFARKQVHLLVYNSQTGGPQTTAVVDAARASGVPVVAVTETLPRGRDYVSWMTQNVRAVQDALARSFG